MSFSHTSFIIARAYMGWTKQRGMFDSQVLFRTAGTLNARIVNLEQWRPHGTEEQTKGLGQRRDLKSTVIWSTYPRWGRKPRKAIQRDHRIQWFWTMLLAWYTWTLTLGKPVPACQTDIINMALNSLTTL
jgi:hypothetical protein